MLASNPVMNKVFGRNIDGGVTRVVNSFGPFVSTNFEMATNVSRVFAFLKVYTKRPTKMILSKISKEDYSAGDSEDMDSYKTEVRETFYKLLRENNPSLRKRTLPAPVTAPLSRRPDRVIDENNIASPLNVPATNAPVSTSISDPNSNHILAPGLFQKLKNKIANLTPVQCSKCKVAEVPNNSSYSTIGPGSSKLRFCSKKCFDDFEMRV
jgi:hypothetical protein